MRRDNDESRPSTPERKVSRIARVTAGVVAVGVACTLAVTRGEAGVPTLEEVKENVAITSGELGRIAVVAYEVLKGDKGVFVKDVESSTGAECIKSVENEN